MATTQPFLGSKAKTGAKAEIKKDELGVWVEIGTGTWTTVSDYNVVFDGSVADVADINLNVSLTDQDPGPQSGPCAVDINGSSATGTYAVSGDQLILTFDMSGKHVTLKVYRVDKGHGTGIAIKGTKKYDTTLHIA